MKYGILGDIHSNLSALETVLERLDVEGVDRILSVGDVVGYGAAPSECIRHLRERGVTVVLGNHDAACCGLLDDAAFNPYARAAVAWTRSVLSGAETEWLARLPLVETLQDCQVAHGTLSRPELFDYVLSSTDAEPSLEEMTRPVCFVGHSHVPLSVFRLLDPPGRVAYTFDHEIDLAPTSRALLNVGSVGQPRDEDPRAAYAVYDSVARQACIHRVSYDVEREVARIHGAGLPPELGERLRYGI